MYITWPCNVLPKRKKKIRQGERPLMVQFKVAKPSTEN